LVRQIKGLNRMRHNKKGIKRETGVRTLSTGDTAESDYARLICRALRDITHLTSSSEFYLW